MRKIASTVYEDLTPRQRVIASVEAEARGDQDERQRLMSSCPRLNYCRTDAAYSDAMERLMRMALAVEADLRGAALSFLIAVRADPKNAHIFLQSIPGTILGKICHGNIQFIHKVTSQGF